MYRWEIATAAMGTILGINPFDQPDVQLAKDMAKKAMAEKGTGMNGAATISVESSKWLAKGLNNWLKLARKGDYAAIQAFIPPDGKTTAALQELRSVLNKRTGLPTTMGYGPRFLHSTGQLHKGGPNTGLFLQLVDDVKDEVPVPETDYTFGKLVRAQAIGDFEALEQRGRRIVRVQLGKDVLGGIGGISAVI
jgi:transaldolase/glucose-6-phosphate isomerase